MNPTALFPDILEETTMVSHIWPKSLLLQWALSPVFGWVLLVLLLLPGSASAWKDLYENANYTRGMADGIHVTDGSYVMNAGELQIHLTNWGLIGSNYSATCPWCDAPSAQWPAGSGNEYLWSAGLWVGAVMLGQRRVSTGQFDTEFRPRDELEDTIYEGVAGSIRRPLGYGERMALAAAAPPLPMRTMTRTGWWTRRYSTGTTMTKTS